MDNNDHKVEVKENNGFYEIKFDFPVVSFPKEDKKMKKTYEDEKQFGRDILFCLVCLLPFLIAFLTYWWAFFPAIPLAFAIGIYLKRKKLI